MTAEAIDIGLCVVAGVVGLWAGVRSTVAGAERVHRRGVDPAARDFVCGRLGVFTSGRYDWRGRPESATVKRREGLKTLLK
ncbi:hypothetical protein ACH4UR_25840 [Streptomyces lydicus]|uniref:hypothetical protein n=1 Tax=Streptomyces lydicus TaxID=47763 RepID=UPI0033E270E0